LTTTLCRLALAFFLLLALASPGAAKEESKIKLRMDSLDGGSVRGDVATKMSADSASLHLKVKGLEPDLEHVLYNDATEDRDDGTELARFTTSGNGSANLQIDLLSLDLGADADPRGSRLSVFDGALDVLEVWVFSDDPDASNPRWSRVKEWTDLAPGEDNVDEEGTASARYQVNPNGKGRLLLALRGVPEGTYAAYVEDTLIADEIVPNSGGNAQVSFRTSSKGNGRSKPHNKKLGMNFDPYLEIIELRQGDDVYFSGVMAAQVEGLNVCEPDPQSETLNAERGGDHEASVTTDVDESCHSTLEVEVSGTGLPVTLYLYVNDELVGSFDAPGSAEFDGTGASGDPVRIDDGAGTDYFTGSLP
jgi:hypothetical protein